MATRSTIAIEAADGTIKQIYCHWDGYLDHNGEILIKHYAEPHRAAAMIELGDISSLCAEYDPGNDNHSFNAPKAGVTIYYGRDRGEEGCEPRVFKDYADYRNRLQGEEYNYILRKDGQWYVEFYGEFDGLLADAMANELIEKEMAEDE